MFIASTEGTLCLNRCIMQIYINREAVEVNPKLNLAEILALQGIGLQGIAVAISNKVVPRAAWATTYLAEGANVTVVSAVCGG